MKTTVVNKKTDDFDINIARPSDWGNPFRMKSEKGRDYCCDAYAQRILGCRSLLARVTELKGKKLGCFCAPKRCHGDTLARLANEGVPTTKYAGVGARNASPEALRAAEEIAAELAIRGYVLRSGGADGMDSAFEKGCDSEKGWKQIYLPWANFNKNRSPLYNVGEKALAMASDYHPYWDRCTEPVQKLQARNCYQSLGWRLDDPVDFMVCWTEQEDKAGGTALAIRIARGQNIPVYNLAFAKDEELFWNEIMGD